MNVVKPNVTVVPTCDNIINHVAKCASICYKSFVGKPKSIIKTLYKYKHWSMFRHATFYYIVPINRVSGREFIKYVHISKLFGEVPYIAYYIDSVNIYISINGQFALEHNAFRRKYYKYKVLESTFIACCPDKSIIRVTLEVCTSIKISRELNRVSPNNISEQSTRYVNFNKKGGVTVCESYEPKSLAAVDVAIIRKSISDSCKTYEELVDSGVRPEYARRVLPIDTATICAYTYTIREWQHIIDLRYKETTGSSAPDAKIIGEMINAKLTDLGYV